MQQSIYTHIYTFKIKSFCFGVISWQATFRRWGFCYYRTNEMVTNVLLRQVNQD